MILDCILTVLIFVALQILKARYPNFLFFPKGAALFLPPNDTQEKPKKKKEKTQQQVSVIKIEYAHVKQYPFVDQFSRIQTTTVGLTIFFPIRYLVSFFYQDQSLFPFYTTCLVLIYTLKLGIDTFFMTNYGRKNCFLIALSINVIFYIFFATFNTNEGVFDKNLQIVSQDFIKHLQIVFNRQISFFSHKFVILLVLVINFFIIIGAIPTIIKFGNWYTKTLKETSYQQQEENTSGVRRQGLQERGVKDQQKRLKEQSQKIIYQLNIYLVFMLAAQFFAHRYIHQFMDQHIVFICQAVCLGICAFITCSTIASAIQFNGSFGYKYVMQFFQTQDKDKKDGLKKKIVAYIYYIWYHYFQFLFRIIVPLLLFLLIVNWKYLNTDKQIINGSITTRQLNPDVECSLLTDQLSILENLYKCSNTTSTPNQLQSKFFLNGIIQSIPKDLQSSTIQNNIQKYGLVTRDLMLQFWQQLFWYSSLSIYLMTVFYILFLRKTVYDI